MTNNLPRLFALLLLGLTLAELAFLSALVPVDAAVYDWVEAHRSCALDRVNTLLHDWPVVFLVILSALAFVWLCVRQQWPVAWHGTLTICLGLLLSEVLKTGFERARPSVLPPLFVGNSFPSGHIMGALLIVGTLNIVITRQSWAARVKLSGGIVLLSLVSVITWQRLYLAHHWFSDVLGSFLLAGFWLCFAWSRPAAQGAWQYVVLPGVVLLVCYPVFYFFPATRLALPSVMSTIGEPLFTVSFGESGAQTLFHGAWGVHTREPVGPITWMQKGEASVELRFPRTQAYTLRFAARPFVQSKAFACFPLEVKINRQPAGRLLLYRGWREYALHVNPSWLVPDVNVITFQVGADCPASAPDQRTVAFRYLRLFAERR